MRLDADQSASPFASLGDPAHHGRTYFANLRRRLQRRLLFAYITPLLMLSAFFHVQYNETLRQGVKTHLQSVAENKRNTVSLFLQERVANTKNAFRFSSLPPSAEEMRRVLRELREESPAFVDLGLFNPRGILVAYGGPYPQLLGKDYSGEVWLRRARRSRRMVHISDVYLGFRGRSHFIIAVRKQDWVLRASLDPERFTNFVGRSILMKNAEAFIVNRAGRRQTAQAAGPAAASGSVPRRSLETQVLEVDVAGVSYLSAFAWLAETEWALVMRIPTRIAYAPVGRARLILVGVLLGALGIIVFFVNRSTRRIVNRLEQADRAKEDLQRQLFNAAKLASVGEMAAGVAHEINNPLAIIYEEAGLMDDALDPTLAHEVDLDEFKESIGVIKEASMRGRAITSKLMAFARRHDAEPEPTRVNELVEKVLAIKEHQLRVSNIEIVRELGAGLPRVMANPNQLEQVLLNLVNNAVDAVGDAGSVTIRTRALDRQVVVEVDDTGGGMTGEQMEKIFFPFFTTKAVGKGTGLGLSISYGIVKALGGRIEVTSEVGEGSSFTVYLPAAREARDQGDPSVNCDERARAR
jgi:two-component system NtrC family sensor kinase